MPLPPNNKFAKPGAKPAAKPAAKPKPKPKPKRFGAPSEQVPRDPMLDARPEPYRVRHIGAEELVHPEFKTVSWRLTIEVVETGEQSITLHMNTTAGISEFQRQAVATAGYDNPVDFTEFAQAVMPEADADEACDAFFESVIGTANAFSEAGFTLDRRLVDVVVSRGKPVLDKQTQQPKIDARTGEPDYYRNYKWTVVPDEEQDEAGKLEASA